MCQPVGSGRKKRFEADAREPLEWENGEANWTSVSGVLVYFVGRPWSV